MKKIIIIIIGVVLVIASVCIFILCNQGKKEELPSYYIVEKKVEKLGNNEYKVWAIVQNVSDKDISYSYIVSTAYNSKKEYVSTYVLDSKNIIKANEKEIVTYTAIIESDDVQTIYFDLLDKDENRFNTVNETDNIYEELFAIDDYQYTGGDISIEYQNVENLKINNLEMTAYDENQRIICISYIEDPKLTKDRLTTYTFKCDEPVDAVKTVVLSYY